MRIPFGMIVLVGAVAVAGCSQKGLRDIRKTGTGPDEFLVLPNKPLNEPADYSSLPEPTPGAGNIADPTPQADAIAALGGCSAVSALNSASRPLDTYDLLPVAGSKSGRRTTRTLLVATPAASAASMAPELDCP